MARVLLTDDWKHLSYRNCALWKFSEILLLAANNCHENAAADALDQFSPSAEATLLLGDTIQSSVIWAEQLRPSIHCVGGERLPPSHHRLFMSDKPRPQTADCLSFK